MFKPLLCLLALQACASHPRSDFEGLFTGRTLRIELSHTNQAPGPASGALLTPPGSAPAADPGALPESFSIEALCLEQEWAGPREQLIELCDTGKYRIELRELATERLLYSRGYCSIYGEWETTPEAKEIVKSFEESLRVPQPRASARISIHKRAEDGSFKSLFTAEIPPAVRASLPGSAPATPEAAAPSTDGGEVEPVFVNGDSASHVDLLVVADGYTHEQRDKFLADTKRLVDVLFQTEPFRRRKSDFNVRALFVPSKEAGISNPRKEIARENPLGLSYNAFGSDRYVLTMRDRELRRICARAPYDALILLFNERKYGGGGIYNLWATVAADTEPAAYIFVHEFGHSFAGLGDEYYSSQVAYEEFIPPGVEPWEPNVTALLDPAKLKWSDLVAEGTPLPTPWGQARFDEVDLAYQKRRANLLEAKATEEEMELLFREVKATTAPLLAQEAFAGKVGAFEGSSYQAKGLYRPEVDCIMFTRNPTSFCRVCERAIERTIDSYVR